GAVRIHYDDNAFGAVFAGVKRFVTQLAVAKRFGTAERGIGIGSARLVCHNENDFVLNVDVGVIVVAQLRSGDPVTGKGERSSETSLVGKTEGFERVRPEIGRVLRRRESQAVHPSEFGAERDVEGLKITSGLAAGLEPDAAELSGDIIGGARFAGASGAATFHVGRGQRGDMTHKLSGANRVVARAVIVCLSRATRTEGKQNEKKKYREPTVGFTCHLLSM